MYCVKCGTKLLDDATFCHRCGQKVVSSAIPQPKLTPKPIPKPQPKPVCKDQEEENFYRTHCESIKGLREYVAKYPKGFYWLEATNRIDENERKWRSVRKALRLIAVIIGVPFFVIYALPNRNFGPVVNLINWYRRAESRDDSWL